jgi:hypothetical protein
VTGFGRFAFIARKHKNENFCLTAKGEIERFTLDEMKSTHPPSRRISLPVGQFHIAKQYFNHPQGWISLKKSGAFASDFFCD